MDRVLSISNYVSMHLHGDPHCLFIDGFTVGGPKTDGTGCHSERCAANYAAPCRLRLRLSDEFRNAEARESPGGTRTPVLRVPDVYNEPVLYLDPPRNHTAEAALPMIASLFGDGDTR